MQEPEQKIHIKTENELPDGLFIVTVTGPNKSRTEHRVSLSEQYYQDLTGGIVSPHELLRRSFLFLLEREPKESILASFDLAEIGKYFPEYQTAIKRLIQHN